MPLTCCRSAAGHSPRRSERRRWGASVCGRTPSVAGVWMSRRLFRSARSNNWAVNGFSLSVAFGSKMELGPSFRKKETIHKQDKFSSFFRRSEYTAFRRGFLASDLKLLLFACGTKLHICLVSSPSLIPCVPCMPTSRLDIFFFRITPSALMVGSELSMVGDYDDVTQRHQVLKGQGGAQNDARAA